MTRAEILEQAAECVYRDREQDYGSPENNFALIAELWTIYKDTQFTPKDVAMMMALLKIARIKHSDKPDSFVDLAGYAACGGEITGRTMDEKRLKVFEDMLASILKQYDDTTEKMAKLKTEGKENAVTYRQFFANKLQLQAMLSYYQTYGLVSER